MLSTGAALGDLYCRDKCGNDNGDSAHYNYPEHCAPGEFERYRHVCGVFTEGCNGCKIRAQELHTAVDQDKPENDTGRKCGGEQDNSFKKTPALF